MTDRLLPCVFDGAEAVLQDIGGKFPYRVRCTVCRAITRNYRSAELATEAWNSRIRELEPVVKSIREGLYD